MGEVSKSVESASLGRLSIARLTPALDLRRAGIPLLLLGLLLALLFADKLPVPAGFPPGGTRAALLVIFTIGSWSLNLLPEPLTTLLFFLLATLFRVAGPGTIFSGFETPTWWLVFGGAVIGIAIRTTGLGARLGRFLFLSRSATYRHYVAVVVLSAVALAFVMPSTTGRVLLLTPIVLALAERLGFTPGRPGRSGLVLAVAAATYMPPTAILPANIPNTVLLGAAETLYGIKLQYGSYFLLHFPILGALKTLILIWLIARLFPDTVTPRTASDDGASPLTGRECLLIAILLLSLLLFATDFWHGISPSWVSLGAGILCLLPQTGIVSAKAFNEHLQVTPLIYVAGFLGLSAVIAQSGLGEWAGHQLLQLARVTPARTILNLPRLAAIGAGTGLLTTLPGLPAVLTPLAKEFSEASGLSLYAVLMLQVPVFSTVFLPYQSPPMIIAMQMGSVGMKDASKLCLASAAIAVVALLPLDFAWWRLLGIE